jgi:hypothetical protein
MFSVACPTAVLCLGVGSNGFNFTQGQAAPIDPTTGAIPNGQSVQSIVNTGAFFGVACPTTTACLAVGDNSVGSAGVAVPLNPVNGENTALVQTITGVGFFNAVACPTTTECLAVGGDLSGNSVVVPIDPTSGSLLSGQSVHDITGMAAIAGITCPSSSECLAVGTNPDGSTGAAVLLDPTSGAILGGHSVQDIPANGILLNVACASSTQCLGIGSDSDESTGQAVALDPTTGAVSSGQSVQTISGTGVLFGVACPTSDLCQVMGSNLDSSAGVDVPLDPTTGSEPIVPGPYSPLAPVRICDTRAGNPSGLSGMANQCDNSTIAAGGTLNFNVAGVGAFGVPADATAVVLNVTAVGPSAQGHLIVFPQGATQPVASNINYAAGQNIPNLVEVGTGSGGGVSIFSLARADVVVDLEGYVAPSALSGPGAGLYDPLSSPARICDTRAGNPSGLTAPNNQCNGGAQNPGERLIASGSVNVQMTGDDNIPDHATAVVLNVTAVNPAAQGFLTVYPQGGGQPTASNVNYVPGKTSANRVIVPLSSSGAITVFSSQAADVVVDVSGYYSAASGSGAQFSAENAPVRICDTRTSSPTNPCTGHTISPGGTLLVHVAGMAGVPSTGATAVVVNLTGIDPSQQTFLTVFPQAPRPPSSDLNPAPGTVRANLVVATLSSSGTITIYNNAGSIDVVVDVLGWYSIAA